MSLLDFLVTSDVRKELLSLLWGQSVETSVHQLAQLTGKAYSAVYSELESMKEAGLVLSRKKGRAVVFQRNDRYPEREALEYLMNSDGSALPGVVPSDEDVQFNLARYGAPLVPQQESAGHLSLEETLAAAMALARHYSTVARSLPIVLARNRDHIQWPRLEFLVRKQGSLPVLGFFLDLTASLLNDRKMHRRAQRLMDHRRRRMEDFFVTRSHNKFEDELAEKNTPAVARAWHFRMNMGMDSFESLFKKNLPHQQ